MQNIPAWQVHGLCRRSWQLGASDFFYLKGVLEHYFARLGIEDYSL